MSTPAHPSQSLRSVLMNEHISLYFHIPFCKRKCDYCHFYVIPELEESKEKLLHGFFLELSLLSSQLKNKKIVSIYFGGGTPSLFSASRIRKLMDHIRERYDLLPDAEVTLEANPENLILPLMQEYVKAGINRVSIGIQTLDKELLHLLGRQHDPEIAIKAIHNTSEAGIKNISIDLMYDLPKQTLPHWQSTLIQLNALPITHLSLYNLTIEPHTLFFKREKEIRKWLPDEESSLAMYETAQSYLKNMGLDQYEISAFAKPGYESKHNTGYWTGRSFLGLGPSAFSYWDKKRTRNISHLEKYLKHLEQGTLPIDFQEQLDPDPQRRELFVIRLRLLQGILIEDFNQTYGPLDGETQKILQQLIQNNYLIESDNKISLTPKGILFYDFIASELI